MIYKEIENKLKEHSMFYKENKYFLALIPIYSFIISLIITYFVSTIKNKIIGMVLGVISFYIIIYLYIFIKTKTFRVYKIESILREFDKKRFADDKQKLIKLFKEYKIDNQDKVAKFILHYQILIPRKIKSSGTFLSLIAICIGLASFLYVSEENLESRMLAIMTFICIFGILYGFAKCIYYFFYKVYGNFNVRMEDLSSSIYFEELIKKEEDINIISKNQNFDNNERNSNKKKFKKTKTINDEEKKRAILKTLSEGEKKLLELNEGLGYTKNSRALVNTINNLLASNHITCVYSEMPNRKREKIFHIKK